MKTTRFNTLLPSPEGGCKKLAVVQFKVPGAKNGGTDKGPDGNRIDSIPIANGVIKAGGACDMLLYDYEDHAGFEATIEKYDALIVRINPGQLSQIPGVDGVQAKFDATMNAFVGKGKPVWSSPGVQQKMGAKDALCKIANNVLVDEAPLPRHDGALRRRRAEGARPLLGVVVLEHAGQHRVRWAANCLRRLSISCELAVKSTNFTSSTDVVVDGSSLVGPSHRAPRALRAPQLYPTARGRPRR